MLRSRVLAVVTVVYLLVVAWITLNPAPPDTRRNAVMDALLVFFTSVPPLSWVDYLTIEFTANILMFVPMGVLFTLILGRWRWWLVLAIGVAATLTIEFVQLFLPARFSEPRDLLSNTIGTVIGILLVFVATGRRGAAGRGRTADRARA